MTALIKKKEHLFHSHIWVDLLKALPPRPKRGWAQLLALANGAGSKDGFTRRLQTYLVKVRSHGGYHYNQTKPIADSYLRHFKGAGPESSYAFVSMGKTFEETRFFFADAAITALSEDWKRDLGRNFDQEFSRYLKASHTSIRSIIWAYLKKRGMDYQQVEFDTTSELKTIIGTSGN